MSNASLFRRMNYEQNRLLLATLPRTAAAERAEPTPPAPPLRTSLAAQITQALKEMK